MIGMLDTKDRLILICFCIFIFASSFLYYVDIIHYIYYNGGPYLYDMGWLNYIVGGHHFALENPSAIGVPNFFYVHMSRLLILFSGASALLGLKSDQPLEFMLGVGFAGSAVAAMIVVHKFLLASGKTKALLLGLVFTLAYSLSGIMRSIASYPHFEILYVALAPIALYLMFQRNMRAAWVVFLLCLSVREDAGLHIACILTAYLVLAAIEERGAPERLRDLSPFLAAALVYPVVAIGCQRAFFPSQSTFSMIYSGVPAYAHLTGALVAQRFMDIVQHQTYVPLTLAAALSVALVQWRWVALAGIAACVPWFLLNITAVSSAAGSLGSYYPFPFLVLALVPFIVCAPLPDAKPDYVNYL
jgi:hypothetical protein